MPKTLRWCTAVFLLAVAVLAQAATDKDKDKEATYDVEVLVFENRLPDLVGDELLAQENAAPPRDLDAAIVMAPAGGDSYFRPAVTTLLERDGHYRILAWHHWVQTVDAKTPAKPMRIGSAQPGELDGTIRFVMSRYLHLDVNLLYRETGGDSGTPVTYRIGEQRRIKSQELNYFDHPKFGVLVRVMPVETDKKP